jgi:hypothetical protein
MTNDELNETVAILFCLSDIPDAATDLNVVRSLWKSKLSPSRKRTYKKILREIVFRESIGMDYMSHTEIESDVYGLTENASPRQRTKALIETARA